MNSKLRLYNRKVLVTGASNGIGRAIVDLFLENGAQVIGIDIEPFKNLDAEKKYSKLFKFFQMDVSKEEEWKKIQQFIQESNSSLDVLINNAGINGIDQNYGLQDPENIDISTWRYLHENNLESVVLSCKYMIKLMKRKEGDASIINVASRSGLIGVPNLIAYASSKASIINLTKSVALYCAEQNYNIRCNVINPGVIETRIWNKMFGSNEDREKSKERLLNEIPLKKMGQPIDVAYAALYLASEESKFVTASSILIDGGCTAETAGKPKKYE